MRPERFELPTFGSVDRRSIQLSYGRAAAILVGRARRAWLGPDEASEAQPQLADDDIVGDEAQGPVL
jgi:hypothetical protein